MRSLKITIILDVVKTSIILFLFHYSTKAKLPINSLDEGTCIMYIMYYIFVSCIIHVIIISNECGITA